MYLLLLLLLSDPETRRGQTFGRQYQLSLHVLFYYPCFSQKLRTIGDARGAALAQPWPRSRGCDGGSGHAGRLRAALAPAHLRCAGLHRAGCRRRQRRADRHGAEIPPLEAAPCARPLLGRALASLPQTEALKPGLKLATSAVLRTGIVCVGAKLSAAQVLSLGWTTVPAAACSVAAGVAIIPALAARCGLAPRLGALLACGTSICGVTAISAVAPAIAASQAEVAIAVANVVAFGSLGMLAYPHLAHALFPEGDSQSIGLFLGLAVHDTAQVMGCAASYAEQYSDAAVVGAAAVAKLTRNVFLAAVVPFMAIRHAPEAAAGASGGAAASVRGGFSLAALATAVPSFVGGFLALAAVRTLGDQQLARGGKALGLFDAPSWRQTADWLGATVGTKVLLGTGLAAVGLSVDFGAFRGAGLAPFAVGAAGATIVGSVGLGVALLIASLRTAPIA